MTHISNSKVILDGIFSDASVYVPANTTYKEGTVLGRNSSGKLTAFSSDLNVAAAENVDPFTSSPLYILAQTITNADTTNAATIDLVRVLETGTVDASKIIFVKTADASVVANLDALHTNGIRLVNNEQQFGTSSIGE
jgi:hypothetical protein